MKLKSWLQAARIPSNVNLIFPLLMGQAIAVCTQQVFSWPILILVMLFGWFDQLFIVFMNDYADVDADHWPLSSPPPPLTRPSSSTPLGTVTQAEIRSGIGIECRIKMILRAMLQYKG